MGRSDYSDDCDQWATIRWRGAVTSAINGARGQAFLKEMLTALDSLPEKKLIAEELEKDGLVCAMGAVGKARGVDMKDIDPEDAKRVAAVFGIAPALAREIAFWNDDSYYNVLTPEARFIRMRQWVVGEIKNSEDKNE